MEEAEWLESALSWGRVELKDEMPNKALLFFSQARFWLCGENINISISKFQEKSWQMTQFKMSLKSNS